MTTSSIFYSTFCFALCFSICHSFSPLAAGPSVASNTAIQYQSETSIGETAVLETPIPVRKTAIPKPSKRIKTLVDDITSLDELKYFLEEDERPVVIKFYAKWCKKCQQLGMHFDRLAMQLGDRIVDQQFIDGDVRFAAIEYNQESQAFITEELQIKGVPTVQMYVGARKLLDAGSSIKNVRKELAVIEEISHADLLKRAEEADDGILTTLIEDSFYDSPDFLNEEW